eukprot:g1987.t1
MFQHTMQKNIAKRIEAKEHQESVSIKRNRGSIFRKSLTEKISERQNKYFTTRIKSGVFLFSLIYIFVLIAIIIGQLINIPFQGTCEKTLGNKHIWEERCKIKIPFCKNPFQPKCNCASLFIENDMRLTKLPGNIVNEMDGLRRVYIRSANLTEMPENMERLTEISYFEISFSKLKRFDVDVGKWTKLVTLYLMYNNIVEYNTKAVWTHKSLVNLALDSNYGIGIPNDFEIHLPFLNFLYLANNSVVVDVTLTKKMFPNIMYLYLNGNQINKFPDESLQDSLTYLGIARCNLLYLPSYISKFTKLTYIDARDNNITEVDENFEKLIKANEMESYFSGNPICETNNALDCKPLCSKYCWHREVIGDGICDLQCDSKKCEYDGGDCSGK